MLRYVKFHLHAPACEHCGAALIKGAIELSDGVKYGRDCAARAMGRKREDSAMKRQIEELRAAAIRDERRAAYRALTAERAAWTWLAKGYGGNVGWPESDAYRLPDGRVILEMVYDATTLNVVFQKDEDRVLGLDTRAGRMILLMTPEEVNAKYPSGGAMWTTKRWARWVFRKGWDE